MGAEAGNVQPPGTAPEGGGQDEGGQGDGQQQQEWQGLYGSAVENAPPELQPHIAEYLKGLEPNFNRPFQELAEIRQQWEPYNDLGLNDLEPEAVGGLLDFAGMVGAAEQGDDAAIDELYSWWEKVGDQFGYFPGEEEDVDGAGDLEEEEDPLDELRQQNQQLAQQIQAMQGETQVSQLEQQNDQMLNQLAAKDGIDLSSDEAREDVERIYRIAYAYADGGDPDAITKGYEEWKAIAGRGQQQLVGNGRPAPSLGGGEPATEPEEVTGWKDAHQLAMRRARGQ